MKGLIAMVAVAMIASPALACTTHWYREAMDRMHRDMDIVYSGWADNDFARGMKPHHQGAVDMADIVLQHGDDPEVKALAHWIKRSQLAEIAIMTRWIDRRGAVAVQPRETPAVAESHQAMATMHHAMNIRYTGDADLDFVCGMIPHHQGAVDMAAIELRHGRDPEMLRLARTIIPSQRSDIARMERWLKAQGKSCALETTAHHH